MKTAVKSPESAVYRRGLGIFLTETPPPEAPNHRLRPLFPRNPHFPASGPTQWLFQGPPAESKFLAVLPGISSARQVELWQRAIQTLARCQQRLDSPEMRRNKASLETEAKKIAQAMNEAQAALANIAANVGPISPLPAKDKPKTNQP